MEDDLMGKVNKKYRAALRSKYKFKSFSQWMSFSMSNCGRIEAATP